MIILFQVNNLAVRRCQKPLIN